MSAESADHRPDLNSVSGQPGFIIREATVLTGSGGIAGAGLSAAPALPDAPQADPTIDLVCARCGMVGKGVPVVRAKLLQHWHEREHHPEVSRKRQELRRSLRELDRDLWGG